MLQSATVAAVKLKGSLCNGLQNDCPLAIEHCNGKLSFIYVSRILYFIKSSMHRGFPVFVFDDRTRKKRMTLLAA